MLQLDIADSHAPQLAKACPRRGEQDHQKRKVTVLIALDLNGIAVSSGSACSSGKVAASYVLAAMGVEPALARGAIRVSIGPTTTEAEIERFLATWRTLLGSLLKGRREIAA